MTSGLRSTRQRLWPRPAPYGRVRDSGELLVNIGHRSSGLGRMTRRASTVENTVKFSEACAKSRSATAIAAAVCMLAAVAGCWMLRVERATSDPASPAVTAVGAVNIDHAASPVSHAPVKSAGLHRDRPPSVLRVVPAPQASPALVSLPGVWSRPGITLARAPGTDYSGRDLLTQFCVARR